MPSTDEPIDGRLAAVLLRVDDAPRAAAFFGGLFGWTFAADGDAGRAWTNTAAGIVEAAWRLAISEKASEPRVRLGFEVGDPAAAFERAKSLGGAGSSPEAASDSQGLPIAFLAPEPRPAGDRRATGELGVAVGLVADTAKARDFYARLFGDRFGQIGRDDRWWSDRAAFGLFAKALGGPFRKQAPEDRAADIHSFVCVRDLDAHKARVGSLGGQIISESAMGPYQVCECRDDQGSGFHLWRDPAK